MAQGDLVWFDQALLDAWKGVHNLSSDTLKAFITDGSTSLATTTADPRYGAGGTTNLASEEVSAGGNYSTGGQTLGGVGVSLSGGAAVLDANDLSDWEADPSNPTDARYIVIYNDTAAGKQCLFFIDLGATFNMTTGPLSCAFNASGIASKDQA